MRNKRSPVLTCFPLVKLPLLDETCHPRNDVHLVDRDDTADEIARFRLVAAGDRGYRNRRRRCNTLGREAVPQQTMKKSAPDAVLLPGDVLKRTIKDAPWAQNLSDAAP